MASPIELRDLRVFLVLAEELHFGRTAGRLGLTQSRVSQTVAALERRTGGRLFDRTSRRVQLTDHGRRLRDAVEPHYTGLLGALDTLCSDDEVGARLGVGLITAASTGADFLEIVRRFGAEHPHCRVDTVELGLTDPLGPLHRGDIDLIAVRLPFTSPGVTVGPVISVDDRVLLVARDDPLAAEASVSIEVLGDRAVCDVPALPHQVSESVLPSSTPAGRPIRRALAVASVVEVLAAVARGEIVHPSVACLTDFYRHPDVVVVPLHDAPPSRTALAWLTDSDTPAARAFAAHARAVPRRTTSAPPV